MIALHLHNEPLDLLASTTVTVTAVCPVFDRGALDRVYTFPFKVGATPGNLNKLRHPQRLDSDATRVLTGARLYLQGVAFQEGVIEIVKVESSTIEIVFKSQALYLSERLRATKLRTLSMPVAVTEYLPVIDIFFNIPPEIGVAVYLIEVNGTLYQNNGTATLSDDINDDVPGLTTFSGDGITGYYLHIDTSVQPTVVINLAPPSPADPGVDEYIFGGHDPQQTDAEETVRDDWKAHLATVLATPDDHVFPVLHAPEFFKNNPGYTNPYVNYIQPDGEYPTNEIGRSLPFGIEGPFSTGWPWSVVPMPFVNDVLSAIFSSISVTDLGGTWFDVEELAELIVFNTRSLDRAYTPRDFSDPNTLAAFLYIFAPFNGWAASYNLAEHLPDISGMDFLDRLATTFCLCYTLPGGRPRISFCRDLLTAEPEDWTSRAEAGYGGTLATTTGFTLDYDRQSDDTVISGQLERVDGGNNAQDFIAGWFTCFMQRLTEGEREWLVPTTEQEGQSQYYNSSAKQSMRLLFYRGVQEDSAGNSYPLATHGIQNAAGETVGNISLDWNGENGRYQQFFKEYVRILTNGSTITRLVRLSVADLVALLEWRAILKTIYSEDGAFTGVVKSVRFKVSLSGMSAAEVEFVKI